MAAFIMYAPPGLISTLCEMPAAAAFGTRIARKGAKRTKTFRVLRPFREFRGSQLPPKRPLQQRLEQVLRLALGFALLGAQPLEFVDSAVRRE